MILGKSKNKYKTLIGLFVCLYVMVAGISFFHAIDFFNVGNNYWMSVILAFAFEVAQAAVLFAILTTDHKKSWLAWIMLVMLVTVQCSANVFSVYKYMSLSDEQFYQYIKDSLLFWMYTIDEKDVKVTVSWIIGALLPLIALGMTAMVADTMNYVEGNSDDDIDNNPNKDIYEETDVEIDNNKNDKIYNKESKNKKIAEIKGEEKPLRKNLDVIVAHEEDDSVNKNKHRQVNYHTTI